MQLLILSNRCYIAVLLMSQNKKSHSINCVRSEDKIIDSRESSKEKKKTSGII